jgi:hypothetical protein
MRITPRKSFLIVSNMPVLKNRKDQYGQQEPLEFLIIMEQWCGPAGGILDAPHSISLMTTGLRSKSPEALPIP